MGIWIVEGMASITLLLAVYAGRSVIRDGREGEMALSILGALATAGGPAFMGLATYTFWQFISAGGL